MRARKLIGCVPRLSTADYKGPREQGSKGTRKQTWFSLDLFRKEGRHLIGRKLQREELRAN